MNRKEFIKNCGFACMSAGTLGVLLQSCVGSKIISATISGDNIILPLADFEVLQKNEKSFRKYIIVQNQLLKFPICVYRFSESKYTALYMQCTHQGTELTAYGDKLICSAHGSEFDNKGNVQSAPADKALKSFPVVIENQSLKISLKAS
jgi:Rieske Fe-S protein